MSGPGTVDVRMFTVGAIQENAYIVRADASSEHALLIDPGDEPQRLLDAMAALGVKIEAILITHCHFDHIGAVAPLARATGAPVYCPQIEVPLLRDIMRWTPPGFGPFESWEPEQTLAGGERLTLAGLDIEVLFTPGHSPGHLTYVIDPAGRGRARTHARAAGSAGEQSTSPPDLPATGTAMATAGAGAGTEQAPAPALLSGDVLFQGSIGRTDLPGGDWNVLERSIETLMERLPGQSTIYPGHMGVTTLAAELQSNPFLAEIRTALGQRAEVSRDASSPAAAWPVSGQRVPADPIGH